MQASDRAHGEQRSRELGMHLEIPLDAAHPAHCIALYVVFTERTDLSPFSIDEGMDQSSNLTGRGNCLDPAT
jgi:hypothetical protein